MPRLILDGLTKVFERPAGAAIRAVSEVSLTVEEGECLVLAGPSGSGKTTALRLIAGLETPTSGTISIGGTVVNDVAPKDRDVSMVFQSPALYPHMSVYDNLGFGLRLRRWPRQEAHQRILEVASALGLEALLGSMPMALSGGQRQRVAIGRALARRSGAVLLDEPLANIDPALRAEMRTEIAALPKKLGATMIYVTHDHVEAFILGDRVAVLRDGVLQQVCDPFTLYRRPANLFVANFIGARPMNLFYGFLSHGPNGLLFTLAPSSVHASIPDQVMSVPLDRSLMTGLKQWFDKPIVLGVRAEKVCPVLGQTSGKLSACFEARVYRLEYTGADSYVLASCQATHFAARMPPGARIAVGEHCHFTLNVDECCWFDQATGGAIPPECES